MSQKKTKKDFIRESREVHGSAYSYDKTNLVSYHQKVVITCPTHGDFEQKPYNHITIGNGCLKCSAKGRDRKPTITTQEFIKRSTIAHGDRYDYSLSVFTGAREDIEILCNEHGSFWQHAHNHYRDKKPTGCPKCGLKETIKSRKVTIEAFTQRCNTIFNFKYDYSLVDFEKTIDDVLIICPKHGQFKQKANNHLSGFGCAQCGTEQTALAQRFSKEDFITKAEVKHGDKFDYSKVSYVDFNTPVVISCREHGDFKQAPYLHLNSTYCCPVCSVKNRAYNLRTGFDEFELRSVLQHDCKYTYEDVEYSTMWVKVKITCPIHGSFMQTPVTHLSGKGCRECAKVRMTLGYDRRHVETNLYFLKLKHNNYTFLKVGISIDVERRFNTFKKHVDSLEVLRLVHGDCKTILSFEKQLHSDPTLTHYWGATFDGRSECYKTSELEELNVRIDELENQLET